MGTIRAAVCYEFGKPLSIEKVKLRKVGKGEVEVTLEACAVCHSDISYIEGGWGGNLPAVYGHEAVGRISSLGTDITEYKLKDRVLVTLIRACGECLSCAAGSPTQCDTHYDLLKGPLSQIGGGVIEQGMFCGAFAEKVVVDQSQIVKISDDIPSQSASLLSCGVITGVGAVVNTAKVRPGQNVVVIGVGGVGLNAIQAAKMSGARRIIAIDIVEQKLAVAKEFGATDVLLGSDTKPWNMIRTITDGRMADAVFVTVGAIKVFENAPRYLAHGGTVYLVGMPHSGVKAQYEPVILGALSQGMKGSKMGETILKRDIPWIVDMYSQGRLKLDELVSRSWSLDEINEAIADTKTGSARRNVIVF
jgi:S-(hydroxymethyl)glutathione dehydrogenase/alcohol dehydrogenase